MRATFGPTMSPARTNSRSVIREAQLGSLVKLSEIFTLCFILEKKEFTCKVPVRRHDLRPLDKCVQY